MDGGTTWIYWLKQFNSDPAPNTLWTWNINGIDKIAAEYHTATSEHDNCKIKIIDSRPAGQGGPRVDISDAVFKLMPNPAIIVDSPVVTDEWGIGSGGYNITWTNQGRISPSLIIEYTTDGGTTWTSVSPAPTAGQISARSYDWTIPDIGGALPATAKIRVREVSAPVGRDTQEAKIGESAAFKIVTPTITLTNPNAGTIWVVGDGSGSLAGREITWAKVGTLINNLKLDYSTDAGATWNNIVTFTQAQHNGTYIWKNIPAQAAGDSVLIRIEDSRAPVAVSSVSGAIQILPHERITITRPALNEFCVQGDNFPITWKWDGQKPNANLTIRLSPDGGATWPDVAPYIIETQVTNTSTPFNWTVPNTVNTQHAKMRVYDPDDPTDVSSYSSEFVITLPILTVTAPAANANWFAKGTQNITWDLVGSVSPSLKIEYRLNGGGSWVSVSPQPSPEQVGNRSYPWVLPDSAGSTCEIRITDNARPVITVTSSVFNIIAPTITITSPTGGETGPNSWVLGTSHPITWTTTGGSVEAIANLIIKYSINGTNWTTIDTITDAEMLKSDIGSYDWTVNAPVSIHVQIKVYDIDRPATTATSNQFEVSTPSLTVTSPNLGTESWIIGTEHEVTWYAVGAIVEPLSMYYTVDGGTVWKKIDEFDGVNDGTFAWVIPNDYAPGTAKIKIQDNYATPRTDTSDKSFTIAMPTITVQTPEIFWSAGDTKDITWITTGTLVGPIKVEWSKDNFDTTHVLSSVVDKMATTYAWTIPVEAVSTSVRTKVTDLGRTQSWGRSGNFTVLPSPVITIDKPNKNDVNSEIGQNGWCIGKEYTITWHDNGGAISNDLKLQYSLDGGSTWTNIIASTPNGGSYAWTVPITAQASVTAKIRIYDNTPWKAGTNLIADSEAFEISIPRIIITSPAGGETWALGDKGPIRWTTDGLINDDLTIQYTTDGGVTWNVIVSGRVNDGVYDWTIPDNTETSTNMKIKITDNSSNYGGQKVTATSNKFTLIAVPQITLVTPNGSETYVLGDTVPVTWTCRGLAISNHLLLEVSNDNFVTSKQTVANDLPNTGSYTWELTGGTLTGRNLSLRITDSSRTIITDKTDGLFRIRGGFVLTAPDGGEYWVAKSPQTVTWNTIGSIPKVRLDYSGDGGTTWNVIIASVNNSNSYAWTLPDAQSNNVKVRVSDADDDTVLDESNAKFDVVYVSARFNVLDYDTMQHLSDFTVNEPNGTGWSQTGINSPVTRNLAYPYGTYTTFFTKTNYIDNSVTWSTPKSGTSQYVITAYLENSASAQVTWQSILTYSYSPADDSWVGVGSLERKGKLVGTTELERQDMGAAIVTVYEPDGTTIRKTLTATTPGISGTYSFTYANTTFESGKVYPATLSIDYRGRPYISSANIDVGAEKLQYEFFTKTAKKLGESVATIEAAVAGGTAQTRADIETSRTKLVGDIENVRTKLVGDLAASQTAITGVLTSTKTAINAKADEVKSAVDTGIKSQILNTESSVRSGATLTMRYRTYSGIAPTIDIYNAGNVLELSKGIMTEINATGIYEYPVKFESGWGKGDFTIVCSEATYGSLDALTITVISTDLDQVAGQVAGILGATSNLTNLKEATDSMISQFGMLETALSKMSKDLVSQVKQASKSVNTFDSIFGQLTGLAKQIKRMAGESNVNLEKLYQVSSDKKNDMVYLKNKTQELKAAMDLSKKMIENVANKPVTETWYEYK